MNERKFTRDSLLAFFKELYRIWITERPGPLAASLAYFGIFSIIPITYIAVTVAGFFIDATAIMDQLRSDVAAQLEASRTFKPDTVN